MNSLALFDPLEAIPKLNELRSQLFDKYYETRPSLPAVGYWTAHKLVAISCVPVNLGAAIGALALSGISACTIGVFKVAVFSLSLGNRRLDNVSTYIPQLFEHTITAVTQLALSVGGICWTPIDLVVEGFHLVRFVVVHVDEGVVNLLDLLNPLEGITKLNELRSQLFDKYYETRPSLPAIGYWVAHKIVAISCVPVNLGTAIGTLGLSGISACTIGVFKVAVFAFTLGNTRLDDLSTHIPQLFGHIVTAFSQFALSVGEVCWTPIDIVVEGFYLVRFVLLRFVAGVDDALIAEPEANFHLPLGLEELNQSCDSSRIKVDASDRPTRKVFSHYLHSAATIPLNTIAAVASLATAVFLSGLFIAKIVIHATTTLSIPFPTYAGRAFLISYESAKNAYIDVTNDLADIAVLAYRVSEAIGIEIALAKAMDVIRYIPVAMT